MLQILLGTSCTYCRIGRSYLRAALANNADVEVVLGLEALPIGADTSSGRILNELNQLDTTVSTWDGNVLVPEFRGVIRQTVGRQA